MADLPAGEVGEVAPGTGNLVGDPIAAEPAQAGMGGGVGSDIEAVGAPGRHLGSVHVEAPARGEGPRPIETGRCRGGHVDPVADEEDDARNAERLQDRSRHLEGVGIAVVEGDQEGSLAGRPSRGETVDGAVGIDEVSVPAEMAQLRGEKILLGIRHLMVAQGVEAGLGIGQRLEQSGAAQGERAHARRPPQRRFDPMLHPAPHPRTTRLSRKCSDGICINNPGIPWLICLVGFAIDTSVVAHRLLSGGRRAMECPGSGHRAREGSVEWVKRRSSI